MRHLRHLITAGVIALLPMLVGCDKEPSATAPAAGETTAAPPVAAPVQPAPPPQPPEPAHGAQRDATDSTVAGAAPSEHADRTADDTSAEAIIRAFFLAIILKDRAALERIIMPIPDAGVLWRGDTPPPEILAKMKAQFETITCRRLVAGDKALLPDGRLLDVTAQMSTDDRPFYAVYGDGRDMQSPLWLHRVDGAWRVDAGPIIAARKAAEKKRRELQAPGESRTNQGGPDEQ